ncbi:D-glycerate dehydrogenase [Alicyclobacillus tolerans]|uniref:2-hydroxyacid dehydrogenase n=1 Tax=Alicyclobacillus tolerans TaxID=90970 RepID=UPI001F1B60C2|nr:D-glycerate dehydrogenase [Alicyclobacillus tolerans]MCF8565849.1 D-glycerate dehydrogenase [Alicyclobacillus tolerans]
MGRPRVFVPNSIPRQVVDFLMQQCNLDYLDTEDVISREVLYEHLPEAEGLICYSRIKIDRELLDHAPRLRVVSNIAVGYDNFDLHTMNERKILGTNTPEVLTETTADLAFALLMAAARRIPEADRHVKEGRWKGWYPSLMVGKDVWGSTLGIVGMGRIGEAVARRARGFDMQVLYHNRRPNPDANAKLGAKYVGLDELMRASDYVLVLTPLTPETTQLIGAKELSLMKPDAFFINAARGKVVDEAALVEVLTSGKIAGAGLDVYEQEPVSLDNPLLHMDNVVTLPHIGSATGVTRLKMAQKAADNLVAALSGQVPENLVNPESVEDTRP